MKSLPFVEDIYDLETDQLQELLSQLTQLINDPTVTDFPKGIDSFDKLQRKVQKLTDCIELELDERSQVDNVIGFFTETSGSNNIDLLDDEAFFKSFKQSQLPKQVPTPSMLEIDPQHVLDDVQSDYSQAIQQQQMPSTDDSRSDTQSTMFGGSVSKIKMNKKDLAAFMKAKLSQTKIGSSVTTQVSATGPQKTNFAKKPAATSRPPVSQPKRPPVFQKPQESSSDEEDWAKANQMLNKPIQRTYTESQPVKKVKKVVTEEHRVINTSKNIYKPCFNMPAKEPQQKPQLKRSVSKQGLKQVQQKRPESGKGSQFSKPQLAKTASQISTRDKVVAVQQEQLEEHIVQQWVDEPKVDEQKLVTDPLVEPISEIEPQVVAEPHVETQLHLEDEPVDEPHSVVEPELEVEDYIIGMKEEIESQYCDDDLQQETLQEFKSQDLLQTSQLTKEQNICAEEDVLPIQQQVTEDPPDNQVQETSQPTQHEQQIEAPIYDDQKSENFYSIRDSQSQSILEQTDQIPEIPKQVEIIEKPKLPAKLESKFEQIKRQLLSDKTESEKEQARDQLKEQITKQMASEKKPEPAEKSQVVVKPLPVELAPPKPVVKKPKVQKPKGPVDDDSLDYSHLFASFYDIFVGFQIDPKSFDPNYAMRETRNIYASFVNLMEGAHQLLHQKIKFDANPLEQARQAYRDRQSNLAVPDHFTMIGKQVNEMENQIISRDQDLMLQAKSQIHLREKFKAQKGKDPEQILKEALSSKITALIDFDRKPTLFYRVIKNKTEVYDIITRSFARKPRWNELPHGLDLRNTWNLLWSWSKIKSDLQKLLVFQRANHFMGAKNVSRKDFLKQNIERARKFSGRASKEFNIMPLTFVLPKEYVDFLTLFSDLEEKEGKMNYWIMKPSASSRGRGISLVNEISQITYGEPMVMQRYLKNPLLLNGYKFDLRIYVLVTSVNPLEAFIYKEGFGRFSTQPYTLDPTDKANKFIHLTNVSINKNNLKNYDVEKKDRQFGGTKVSLGTLRKAFTDDLKIDWDTQIWTQIRATCTKALVTAQNDIHYNPCCFDLYGFDVIFDEELRCWLLEINSSPSLACDTLLDDMIKQRLIDDTIDLVNPLDFDRKRLAEVLERRIQEESQHAGGQQSQSTKQQQKRVMNRDLTYILNGQMPRGYGEQPKMMGNFEMIAPTVQSEEYMKLVGGQKMFGSSMKVSERVVLDGVKGVGSLPKPSDKPGVEPKVPLQKRSQPSQAQNK